MIALPGAGFGLGVKTIHTLGIDGGKNYAPEFANLTPLTNGRRSFDDGLRELERLAQINAATIAPLVNRDASAAGRSERTR